MCKVGILDSPIGLQQTASFVAVLFPASGRSARCDLWPDRRGRSVYSLWLRTIAVPSFAGEWISR